MSLSDSPYLDKLQRDIIASARREALTDAKARIARGFCNSAEQYGQGWDDAIGYARDTLQDMIREALSQQSNTTPKDET